MIRPEEAQDPANGPTNKDLLWLSQEGDKDPRSLVGHYFLSDASRGWQGCVVGEPFPGIYLVETFEWISGSSYDMRLVGIHDMMDWTFYSDSAWMRESYKHEVQRKWDHDRDSQ